MRKYFFFTLFLFSFFVGRTQDSQIDCNVIITQVEKLLTEGDSLTAMRLYKVIEKNKCKISGKRIYRYSSIIYSLGAIEAAKEELEIAINNGLLGGSFFGYGEEEIEKEIRFMYGDSVLTRVSNRNNEILSYKMRENGALIKELVNIFNKDQYLRRLQKYRDCKGYEFDYRSGYSYDTTLNHDSMMICYNEFRLKDSMVLKRFVEIIDSVGYVPGRDVLFDAFPLKPLINHLGHFQFSNVNEILLESVFRGTISPEVYAWYKGYYHEYFGGEHQYYFTWTQKLEALSEEEVKVVNKRRLKIGLPLCPATVWDTKVY